MQKLQEARDAKAKAEKEAQEAAKREADEKARKAGEDLVYEVEKEDAAKQRKREASKEKKAKKKKKKTSPEDEGKSEPSEGEEDKPEADKPKEEKSEKDEPPKDESKEENKEQEGPIKDEEPEEPWIEVVKRAAKPRQNTSKAAEKARARTYPRPMCEATAQVEYVYAPQHVPTRELFMSGKWSVVEKVKDIPPVRNPMRLKDNPHKAILEHGIRRRFTDYKVCVLQVLEAGKQTPPKISMKNKAELLKIASDKQDDLVPSGHDVDALPLVWQEVKTPACYKSLLSDLAITAVFDVTPGSGALGSVCLDEGHPICWCGTVSDACTALVQCFGPTCIRHHMSILITIVP